MMGITRGLVTVLLAFNVFRFGLKEMNGEDGTAVVEKVHISSISLSALLILATRTSSIMNDNKWCYSRYHNEQINTCMSAIKHKFMAIDSRESTVLLHNGCC